MSSTVTLDCMHATGKTCKLMRLTQLWLWLVYRARLCRKTCVPEDSPCVQESHACETKPHRLHTEPRHPLWRIWTCPPWPKEEEPSLIIKRSCVTVWGKLLNLRKVNVNFKLHDTKMKCCDIRLFTVNSSHVKGWLVCVDRSLSWVIEQPRCWSVQGDLSTSNQPQP